MLLNAKTVSLPIRPIFRMVQQKTRIFRIQPDIWRSIDHYKLLTISSARRIRFPPIAGGIRPRRRLVKSVPIHCKIRDQIVKRERFRIFQSAFTLYCVRNASFSIANRMSPEFFNSVEFSVFSSKIYRRRTLFPLSTMACLGGRFFLPSMAHVPGVFFLYHASFQSNGKS